MNQLQALGTASSGQRVSHPQLFRPKPVYSRLYGLGLLGTAALCLSPFALFTFVVGIEPGGLLVASIIALLAASAAIWVYALKQVLRVKYAKGILGRRRHIHPLVQPGGFKSLMRQSVVQSEFDSEHKVFTHRTTIDLKTIDDIGMIGPAELPDSVLKEQIRYRFYDLIVDIYRKSRHSEYKSHERYYTLCELKLRKAVPHLVFDSKAANREQFRSIYLSSQKLEAAAGFEQYFTLYSPKYHAIETLSFITPEVIEAMIHLRYCDFEFIGDSLICYAPLLDKADLATMRRRCLVLHSKVNDNLPLYQFKQSEIDAFGRNLLKRPLRYLPLTLMTALLAGVCLWLAVFALGQGHFSPQAWAGGVLFSIGCVSFIHTMAKEYRKNKKLEQRFLRSRRD